MKTRELSFGEMHTILKLRIEQKSTRAIARCISRIACVKQHVGRRSAVQASKDCWGRNQKRTKVCRKKGSAHDPKRKSSSVKHGGGSVQACMAASGVGLLMLLMMVAAG